VASDLHIEHLLDRQITTLSGGEIQRAAIARTLIRTPRTYLMDEPLSNLDLKLREELRVEFRELHKRYGATMFYVTHDFVSAVSIADRIGILSQGILHQVGSYRELHSDPQTTAVAELMESPPMNFLPCAVENGSLVVNREAGIMFPLTERQQADIQKQATDGRILLGVWPEDIQLGLPEGTGAFRGKIIGREFQGADTLINVSVGKINVKTSAEPGFTGRFGEFCTFFFPKEKTYLFDQNSGKRVYGDWGIPG
jgi:multiple sugar transport system ATP-binding protein